MQKKLKLSGTAFDLTSYVIDRFSVNQAENFQNLEFDQFAAVKLGVHLTWRLHAASIWMQILIFAVKL